MVVRSARPTVAVREQDGSCALRVRVWFARLSVARIWSSGRGYAEHLSLKRQSRAARAHAALWHDADLQ